MEAINRELITQGVHPDGLYFDFLSRPVDCIDVETPDFSDRLGIRKAKRLFYHKYNLNQPLLILSHLRSPNENFERLLSNDSQLSGYSPGSVELASEDNVLMAQARFALIERVGTDLELVKRLQAMTRKEYSEWLIETGLAEQLRDIPERKNIEGADVFHRMIEVLRSLGESEFKKAKLYPELGDIYSDQAIAINDRGARSHPEPVVYDTKKGPKIVRFKVFAQYLDTGGQGYISLNEVGSDKGRGSYDDRPLIDLSISYNDRQGYLDQINEKLVFIS